MDMQNMEYTIMNNYDSDRLNAPSIIGVKGSIIGKIFYLRNDETVFIGRDASQCQIVLKGGAVSRVHLNVCYNSITDDYTIYDTSSNGIIVNYKYKVRPRTYIRVEKGSSLQIGNPENEIILG